jgi:hypothetical protein
MPHLIHVCVGVVSFIVFIAMAGTLTIGEMELEFTTRNPLAMMHTG